ncbi:hypothetical protein IC232_26010 [Microvirga sp. BT688]|uniref:hypothetical protein n=1 Tax=Microvirga sp. TaxID=1873136 RepID=UPI00168A30ED|nr:hypothetical protein [Microvirga sp.]MBD2750125.1 hypothetical protein [Microvirga sp.]
MFRERVTRLLSAHRIVVLTLSLSTAAGWVSLAVSKQSSTKLEGQLRRELAGLQDAQAKLLSERAKTRASLSEMAQLRTDLAAARSEVARLSGLVVQAKPEPPPVRLEASENPRTSDNASKTGSITTKTSKPLPVKAASGDKPSPQDRDGQPAVKIATANSQKKVAEKPQRSATPTIRPELDTASLRQLTKSAEAQAQ